MMKWNNKISYIIYCLTAISAGMLTGCEDGMPVENYSAGMPLVVEGWIEEGEHPIVLVTRALDLNDENASIEDAVEKWCRVIVYDNDTPHILTARLNDDYNPKFIFTSGRLRGQPGHTYRLTVETEDTMATAEATILPAPSIRRLEVVPAEGKDSSYYLRAFVDNVQSGGYYKVFCKGDGDRRHFAALSGNFTGTEYQPEQGIKISRGIHKAFAAEDHSYSYFFSPGESVEVKVCSTDRPVYDFWTAYDLNVSLSHNMFLNFVSDCPGNVTGAKGYWAAYGTSFSACKIP